MTLPWLRYSNGTPNVRIFHESCHGPHIIHEPFTIVNNVSFIFTKTVTVEKVFSDSFVTDRYQFVFRVVLVIKRNNSKQSREMY